MYRAMLVRWFLAATLTARLLATEASSHRGRFVVAAVDHVAPEIEEHNRHRHGWHRHTHIHTADSRIHGGSYFSFGV